MASNQQSISQILLDWSEAKKKIEKYEKKIEEYKKLVEKEMNTRNTDIISSGSFNVKRTRVVRATISRANVPEDIWYKYSKKTPFTMISLTVKK